MAQRQTASTTVPHAGRSAAKGTTMDASNPANDWSDDLKKRTRDAIEGRDIFAPRDGQLCLKHITSGFGTIAEEHLSGGALTVVDRRTGAETIYANADELIAAGWAID